VTSANGDYVVYLSTTTDGSLGADGNGAGTDVFLWTRATDSIVRVTGGDGPALGATVANDGTVAFTSTATDLDGTDGNADGPDVFVYDGSITRVTSGNGHSGDAVISADGTKVLGDESLVVSLGSTGLVVPAAGRTVAVVGLEDVVVVDTGDALLVTSYAHAQEVKAVREVLEQRGRRELT